MAKEELNYTKALNELEQILDEVENSELNIDDILMKTKRAAFLIDYCKNKLTSVEAEIETVLSKIR